MFGLLIFRNSDIEAKEDVKIQCEPAQCVSCSKPAHPREMVDFVDVRRCMDCITSNGEVQKCSVWGCTEKVWVTADTPRSWLCTVHDADDGQLFFFRNRDALKIMPFLPCPAQFSTAFPPSEWALQKRQIRSHFEEPSAYSKYSIDEAYSTEGGDCSSLLDIPLIENAEILDLFLTRGRGVVPSPIIEELQRLKVVDDDIKILQNEDNMKKLYHWKAKKANIELKLVSQLIHLPPIY